jgi:hypothetical protein
MVIRFYEGFWTIFSNGKPLLKCVSFDRAWELVYELKHA